MRRAKKRRGGTAGDALEEDVESEFGGERGDALSDGLLRAACGRAREGDSVIPRAAQALIESALGSVSPG